MRPWLLALVTVGCSHAIDPSGGTGGSSLTGDGGTALDGGFDAPDLARPPKPPRPSPIAAENQLPGSTGWKLTAKSAGLYGYSDRTSYAPGDTVAVHAAADAATTATWELWRMGYYGGTLGRRVAAGGPVSVPLATPAVLDSSTGMVSAPWPTTFSIALDPSLVNGIYLVKLTAATAQRYVIFVVREPAQGAPIVWPVAFNTYQAYNAWGGTSLYDNRRSDWKPWHAFKVSFDRPYEQGDGAGQYFFADRDFTTFAESQGYDIDYLADSDLDVDPHVLAGRALVVLQGHTEYWTADERTAVNGAVGDGTNLVVFGANDLYWQVRYESTNGNPRRVVVCYKDYVSIDPFQSTDPTHVTDLWRNLGQAENALVGVMFGEWLWSDAPLVIDDPSSWLWSGAHVSPGAFIPGLCGFEIDRRYANGSEPAGLAEVGRCSGENHQAQLAMGQSTIYTAPSGATVFASGTVSWSQALAAAGQWDPRIQQATSNLFARLAGTGTVGDPPAPLTLPPGLPAPAQLPGVVVSTVTAALTAPTALAMAPGGDVVVADGNRIVRVTPST
ncbi:MAG TPA: N,N-dimethylformamidase beta subunit family domain-containing protein, partial [Polyangia bacterium]